MGTSYQCCHYVRGYALAVGNYRVECFLAEVVYQEHAKIDRTQLLQQGINLAKQYLLIMCVGDYGIYHPVVAVNKSLKLVFPVFVATQCHLRNLNQFVGYSAKSADYHHYRLALCLILGYTFQTQNTLYGTHGCSAKF